MVCSGKTVKFGCAQDRQQVSVIWMLLCYRVAVYGRVEGRRDCLR